MSERGRGNEGHMSRSNSDNLWFHIQHMGEIVRCCALAHFPRKHFNSRTPKLAAAATTTAAVKRCICVCCCWLFVVCCWFFCPLLECCFAKPNHATKIVLCIKRSCVVPCLFFWKQTVSPSRVSISLSYGRVWMFMWLNVVVSVCVCALSWAASFGCCATKCANIQCAVGNELHKEKTSSSSSSAQNLAK